MEAEDIDKILSKSYSELNAAERETIREICGSEEEFLQLQQFFASVENYAKETQENSFPAPETKERLDDLFHQTYQNKGILWYNSAWAAIYPIDKRFDQRPLVRIAAILVLFISIVPFLNNSRMEEKTALAKNEPVDKERAKDEASSATKAKAETATKSIISDKNAPVFNGKFAERADSISISAPTLAEDASFNGYMSRNTYAPASVTTGATAFMANGATTTFKWTHSDGIYLDTFTYESDALTVKGNLAVLDLLTPTF